jgi:hypothetical protein
MMNNPQCALLSYQRACYQQYNNENFIILRNSSLPNFFIFPYVSPSSICKFILSSLFFCWCLYVWFIQGQMNSKPEIIFFRRDSAKNIVITNGEGNHKKYVEIQIGDCDFITKSLTLLLVWIVDLFMTRVHGKM